jgi:hypothetical protein
MDNAVELLHRAALGIAPAHLVLIVDDVRKVQGADVE